MDDTWQQRQQLVAYVGSVRIPGKELVMSLMIVPQHAFCREVGYNYTVESWRGSPSPEVMKQELSTKASTGRSTEDMWLSYFKTCDRDNAGIASQLAESSPTPRHTKSTGYHETIGMILLVKCHQLTLNAVWTVEDISFSCKQTQNYIVMDKLPNIICSPLLYHTPRNLS